MAKIPESPSYTKPIGKPGDERKRTEKVNYSAYETEHQFKDQGYKGVNSSPKTGKADGSERVRTGKVDYTKFDKEQGHTNEGYKGVGKGAKGAEREESAYKKKSPFRNA